MLEKKKSAEYDTATELVGSIEQMQSTFTQKMDELKEIPPADGGVHSKLSDAA